VNVDHDARLFFERFFHAPRFIPINLFGETIMKISVVVLAGAVILGVTFQSFAQQVQYFPLTHAPSPLVVAKTLVGENFKPRLKMRGVRQLGESAGGQDPVPAEGPFTPDTSNVLAVPIPFAFDSAILAVEAKAPLDQIAEGIKLVQEATPSVVVIEGHTDAVGQPGYNKRLSQRRAAAVKRYLVDVHGVNPLLLKSVGKGEAEPLNPANPRGDENRRVQFRVS
jgi:outer membrane protein OmpA-like peptidoglycan-associated protein